MAHDVFLSYSSQNKPIADACCAGLENAGVRCWIAPRDVLPGTEYGAAIVDAIETSRAMVLVFSSHANSSPHIRREVERALSKGKVIIPYRIERIAPTGALEYALSGTHWLDALTPPVESRIGELVSVVKRVLASGTTAQAAPVTDAFPTGPITKDEIVRLCSVVRTGDEAALSDAREAVAARTSPLVEKRLRRFYQWLSEYNHHAGYPDIGEALWIWLTRGDRGVRQLGNNWEMFLQLVATLALSQELRQGLKMQLEDSGQRLLYLPDDDGWLRYLDRATFDVAIEEERDGR